MIENLGIGIDIVNINRFEKKPYYLKPEFYRKMFLPSEIQYCLKYKNPYKHFAGKFAIKEAIIKSINENISLLEIETFHLNSKLKVKLVRRKKSKYVFIASLSHEKNIAVGVVLSKKIK